MAAIDKNEILWQMILVLLYTLIALYAHFFIMGIYGYWYTIYTGFACLVSPVDCRVRRLTQFLCDCNPAEFAARKISQRTGKQNGGRSSVKMFRCSVRSIGNINTCKHRNNILLCFQSFDSELASGHQTSAPTLQGDPASKNDFRAWINMAD